MSFISGHFGVDSPAAIFQAVGQVLIPVCAILVIGIVSRQHPTDTQRWFSRWVDFILGRPGVLIAALLVLFAGLTLFGASILTTGDGDGNCVMPSRVLAALGLLITLGGAILSGLVWAVIKQAGWVVLATFFALDLWIVFGMTMMHLRHLPERPDLMLLLAFAMHAVCMYLTTVWAFHARNLSAMAQIRAGEAGRSIGAVWIFLAVYIVVSFFHNEAGPFDSANGGAVLSALTLSALALTMGSGYTRYREVMAEQPASSPDQ